MSSSSSSLSSFVVKLDRNAVERLLDRYPFTERELKRLLLTSSTTKDRTTTSSLEGLVRAAASDDDDSQGRPEKEEEPQDRVRAVDPGRGADDVFSAMSGSTILSVLPELTDLYQIALRNVFVVPSMSTSGDENNDEMRRMMAEWETSLEALGTLLGRRGSGNAQQFLWDAIFEAFGGGTDGPRNDGDNNEANGGTAHRDQLMRFLYKAALVGMATSSSSKAWKKKLLPILEGGGDVPVPEGWIHSLSPDHPRVSLGAYTKWTAGNQLYRCVSAALHAALRMHSRTPIPELPPHTYFPDLLEAVALVAMGTFGNHTWKEGSGLHDDPSRRRLLYDSDADGLSFRVWQQALMGFCGPTLFVVRTTNGDCWGYRTHVPWKSSRTWYTATDDDDDNSSEDSCYLFRLSPKWNQYKMVHGSSSSSPSSNSLAPSSRRRRTPYHQYLNVEASHQSQSKALKGLAVGGVAPDAPRVYVTDTLDRCQCSPVDQLFESGPLLSDENSMYFDVDRILVFALCEPSAFDSMRKLGLRHVQNVESARIRAAKVDRAQFVEDVEFSTSLFAHRDQARGRCDFVAMDEETMGYYVRGKQPSTRTVISSPTVAAASSSSSDSALRLEATDEESKQKQPNDGASVKE